ncbi:MAG: GNAT family N-acetyltransferase [Clostridia bacterium]|nr:GNAT family N-acetyltransferase [Clostridia bacterium]
MVRKIQRSDKLVYTQLVRAFYEETGLTVPEKHITDTYKEMMRGSRYLSAFVIINDGETVGYALVSKTYSQREGGNIWRVEELYVLPEHRNKGLAMEFFSFLEANCPDTVKQLRVELAPDSEIEGSLYDKLGFKEYDFCQLIKVTKWQKTPSE